MAKKFGKFLTLTAFAGIAAGIFYYLKNKNTNTDAFDDFDDDLDDETLSAKDEKVHTREYVSIKLHADTDTKTNSDSDVTIKASVNDTTASDITANATVNDTTASEITANAAVNNTTDSDATNKEGSI